MRTRRTCSSENMPWSRSRHARRLPLLPTPPSQTLHPDCSAGSRRPPLLPTPCPAIPFKCHRCLTPHQRGVIPLRYNEAANDSERPQECHSCFEPWYHEDVEILFEDHVISPQWRDEDCSDEPYHGMCYSLSCSNDDCSEDPCQGIGYSPPWYNPTTAYNRWYRRGRSFFRASEGETREYPQGPIGGHARTRRRYSMTRGLSPRQDRGSFRQLFNETAGDDQRRSDGDEDFPSYSVESALHRYWSCSSEVQRGKKSFTDEQQKRAEKQRSAEKEKPIQQQYQSYMHFGTVASCQACNNSRGQSSAAARERGTAFVYSDAKDSGYLQAACDRAGKKVAWKPRTDVHAVTPPLRLLKRAEQVNGERHDDSSPCALSTESPLGESESCVLKNQRHGMDQRSTADLLLLARRSEDMKKNSLHSVMAETEVGKSIRTSALSSAHQTALRIGIEGLTSLARDKKSKDQATCTATNVGTSSNGGVVGGDTPLLVAALDQLCPVSVTAVNSSEATAITERQQYCTRFPPKSAVVVAGHPSVPSAAYEQPSPLSVQMVDDSSVATDMADPKASVVVDAQEYTAGPSPRPAAVVGDSLLWPCVIPDDATPTRVVVVESSEPNDMACKEVCEKHGEQVLSPRPSTRPGVDADDPSSLPCGKDWEEVLSPLPSPRPGVDADSTEDTDASVSHPVLPVKVLLMTQLNETSRVFEGEPCTDSVRVGEAVSGACLPGPEVDRLATAHIDMEIDPCSGGGCEKKEGHFWLESDLEKLDEGWLWSF